MRVMVTTQNRDTVLSRAIDSPGQYPHNDTYRERLIKYILVETIALFIAIYEIAYYLSGTESGFQS